MNFGQELCSISNDVSLEKKVWEMMKPYLKKIAADRHAKGCQVRFVGFGMDFPKRIKENIINDGIYEYYYVYSPTGNPLGQGLIYWDEKGTQKRKSEGIDYEYDYYTMVSDRVLEITLTSENDIIIIDKKVPEEMKNDTIYGYIN